MNTEEQKMESTVKCQNGINHIEKRNHEQNLQKLVVLTSVRNCAGTVGGAASAHLLVLRWWRDCWPTWRDYGGTIGLLWCN